MIKRRSLLLAAPALILPKRFACAQLPQTGAGRAATGGGGTVPTTWDPATLGSGTTLDATKLIATTTNHASSFAQSTTAYAAGKKYCEFHHTGTLGPASWFGGIVNAAAGFPSGYGYAQNGFWFIANSSVNSGNAVLVSSGDFVAMAVDFDNKLIWLRSTTNTQWNSSASGDPTNSSSGAGISFSAMTLATETTIVNMSDNDNQVCAANYGTLAGAVSVGNGTWNFTPPTGYTNW